MPAYCAICDHEDRLLIETDLIRGRTYPEIIKSYDLDMTENTVSNHKRVHMARIVAAKESQEQAESVVLLDQWRKPFERVNKLIDACDKWLEDPDNPGEYNIAPRAEEIDVILVQKDRNGREKRITRRMSDLLKEIEEGKRGKIMRVHVKTEDPRALLIKAAKEHRENYGMLLDWIERAGKMGRGAFGETQDQKERLVADWVRDRALLAGMTDDTANQLVRLLLDQDLPVPAPKELPDQSDDDQS